MLKFIIIREMQIKSFVQQIPRHLPEWLKLKKKKEKENKTKY